MSADARAAEACAEHARAGDTVLLLDAGVVLAADGLARLRQCLPADIALLAHRSDAAVRGLAELVESAGVVLIDDNGWLEQVCGHDHCLGWK